MKPPVEERELLTPAEVAAIFGVGPKTVARWAKAGRLSSIRTLGGHRRFYSKEIAALAAEEAESGDRPSKRTY